MLVQIHPTQVPNFWEAIKFAAIKSDGIEEEYVEYYCLELLQDLLSSKKICFVAQEGTEVLFVVLVEFRVDKMRNMKYLYFNNLYSFAAQDEKVWEQVFADFYSIAKAGDCKAIFGDSGNKKIEDMNNTLGTSCISKKYAYYL